MHFRLRYLVIWRAAFVPTDDSDFPSGRLRDNVPRTFRAGRRAGLETCREVYRRENTATARPTIHDVLPGVFIFDA